MSILYGLYRPDDGEIRLRGQAVRFRSAHDAIRHGLGMVHQDFMLVPTLTVAENLMLGQPSPRAPLLEDRRAVAARITELARRHGLAVDPHARVDSLSVGQQQRVEILKALYRGAEILILDEPTAVLTPQEVDELLAVLRGLAADGRSIVFISHKLDEVLRLADRIAVLRGGRLVATVPAGSTDARALGRLMVGRDLEGVVATHSAGQREPRLMLRDVEAVDDRGLPALRGIDLVVHAGEIVGIAGVDGNGQRELEEVIAGLRPPRSGRILLAGRDVTARDDAASGSPPGSATSLPTGTAGRCFATSPSPTISCSSASTGRPSAGPASSTVPRSSAMPGGWSRRSTSAPHRSRARPGGCPAATRRSSFSPALSRRSRPCCWSASRPAASTSAPSSRCTASSCGGATPAWRSS